MIPLRVSNVTGEVAFLIMKAIIKNYELRCVILYEFKTNKITFGGSETDMHLLQDIYKLTWFGNEDL